MTKLVALLRGVNVGGVNIKMAELSEVVEGLGYTDVKTVLASGNVLFTSTDAAPAAKHALEVALRERFGYEAWVHVLAVDAIRGLIAAYPFGRESDRHAYVVFAVMPEVRSALLAVALDPAVEQARAGEGVIYWSVPKGSTLDSAMGRAQAKASYKPWLTTRNLNTLEKLIR
ncbi:MAG: DUF1697 domain-containing protein [Actinomycetota bacterium]|nr:DUF1697 domain-containing protein [Actinomycetota bacterium]